ncbi:para-nitrobenzyl esterase [Paenibacillus shirakamiensis]|uniref:Carboxylic ester hydrolase n=1 Tax=Paenibacillus shirakamiensis TaxID=1265935 RepID=A0ABS4JD36_9BACL|nr:carboxylesterase/lipase family protein [Paenibacillus shirakamiensis]MBP1999637.1 para-nitrobenzyl esterase [Paenibacillus shirakamiensis]
MDNLIVSTLYGKVEGQSEDGVHIWRGVPYAKPPVGKLRFQAPVSPDAWDGVLEAFEFSAECPQPLDGLNQRFEQRTIPQSEDCLYLNIWRPDNIQDKLPVMVWIHGGAFVTGSGSSSFYEGTHLAAQGHVIVVTLNYRLGPFGFLFMNELSSQYSPNVGLLDQIAALEWVKDNIEAFGGDSERITVFGESAGSMSIAALLAMPRAKGLFQQAIMQSGAAQVLPTKQATLIAGAFLQELGISPATLHELENVPTEHILKVGEIIRSRFGNHTVLLFQPVVDGEILPKDPLQAIEDGSAEGIPLLIGTNKDEGALFFPGGAEPVDLTPLIQSFEMITGLQHGKQILSAYPSTAAGQAQIVTDFVFWRNAVLFAEKQSLVAPVWMYRFDWTEPHHPFFHQAVHAAEIAFVFDNLEVFKVPGTNISDDMKQIAMQMQQAWVAFAHKGTPESHELKWPAYTKDERFTLIFHRDTHVEQDPDHQKRRLIVR